MKENKAAQLYNSIKIAFSMYSKIPMPKSDWTKENMRYVMCFLPLIGVIIGGLSYLWGAFGMGYLTGRNLGVVVLLMIPVFVTGGIHLDGLLDTSDALSSYQPLEKKLEILKDSNSGAFAIIVGICYFLIYFGAYSELSLTGLPVVCTGFVMSRALGGFSIATFPMAKNTGLAATFSDGAQKNVVRVVSVLYVLAAAAVMIMIHPFLGGMAVAGAALEFIFYYKMSMKQFAGITGDLAGFHIQICELVMTLFVVIGEVILLHM